MSASSIRFLKEDWLQSEWFPNHLQPKGNQFYLWLSRRLVLHVSLSWFTVVSQNYVTEAENEYVIRGNSAVMKCKIPSFVADFVMLESWVSNEAEIFTVDNSGKDFGNIFMSLCIEWNWCIWIPLLPGPERKPNIKNLLCLWCGWFLCLFC